MLEKWDGRGILAFAKYFFDGNTFLYLKNICSGRLKNIRVQYPLDDPSYLQSFSEVVIAIFLSQALSNRAIRDAVSFSLPIKDKFCHLCTIVLSSSHFQSLLLQLSSCYEAVSDQGPV